jgi:ubiquinone/menaquinone biosynthesis C-methylase UbiE
VDANTVEIPSKPDNMSNLEFIRLLTPYVFAQPFARERSVLDVGCGSGHGTWLLASSGAERVAALDLEEEKARRVSEFCQGFERFGATAMDAERLGFKDDSFQVVTCFEVIEHVPKPHMLVSEVRRVLAPSGVAFFTTPNRRLRLLPLQRPRNPEHLREYSLAGFRRSLVRYFPSVTLFGVYGQSAPHEYYRKRWRQSPTRVYLRWLPAPARALGRILLRRRTGTPDRTSASPALADPDPNLVNMPVPAPGVEDWPFYVSDIDRPCLNFFAVCGFEDVTVEIAVRRFTRASTRSGLP